MISLSLSQSLSVCLSVCVFLLETLASLAKPAELIGCHWGCGLGEGKEPYIYSATILPPREDAVFAEAMWPLAISTVETCYTCLDIIFIIIIFAYNFC